MGYTEKILLPDERIAYSGHLHWIVYFSGLSGLVVAAGLAVAAVLTSHPDIQRTYFVLSAVALLAGVVGGLRGWIRRATTEIFVTNRRIILKIGLISRRTIEMNLDRVESVLVHQGILGRMLDFGTVVIRGVGSGLEPVADVAQPLEFHRQMNAAR